MMPTLTRRQPQPFDRKQGDVSLPAMSWNRAHRVAQMRSTLRGCRQVVKPAKVDGRFRLIIQDVR